LCRIEIFLHLRQLRLQRGLLRGHLLILLHDALSLAAPAALGLRMGGGNGQRRKR
jgi:hypothetical protein